MPLPKKNPTNRRIQFKPSTETLRALEFIALHTDFRGNTAVIEEALQRWAKELENIEKNSKFGQ